MAKYNSSNETLTTFFAVIAIVFGVLAVFALAFTATGLVFYAVFNWLLVPAFGFAHVTLLKCIAAGVVFDFAVWTLNRIFGRK
jgi:hypothetical protein